MTRTVPNKTASQRIVRVGLLLLLPLLHGFARHASSQDDLERRASWTAPTTEQIRTDVIQWLNQADLADDDKARFVDHWNDVEESTSSELLRRFAVTAAQVIPEIQPVVEACQSPFQPGTSLELAALGNPDIAEIARNNLRLHVGMWMVNQRLFNEGLEQLSELSPDQVIAPASLLFYQSVIHHHLLEKDQGLRTLRQLLENEAHIPRRYAKIARLMEADLKPVKEDSLNEISRLMGRVENRLGHGRVGKRVRQEEDEVIAKLDKLIEQLEQQRQQSQSGGSQSGGPRAAQPMQDSMPGGGTGPGNVDPKQLANKRNWGDLPPKERQEALQQLGKEYPSHYRLVIEEYFRKLAQDK